MHIQIMGSYYNDISPFGNIKEWLELLWQLSVNILIVKDQLYLNVVVQLWNIDGIYFCSKIFAFG